MEDNNKIKKMYLFIVFCVGILLPIITNCSLWEFGFLAGLGIRGFLEELNKI